MTGLVSAYERRDVHGAEEILRSKPASSLPQFYYADTHLSLTDLKENRETILRDGFIRAYIDDVLRSLRTQYLVDLIKPYTRMELSFLAKVGSCFGDSTQMSY
jgi:COP9 signalosome complex subunit 2